MFVRRSKAIGIASLLLLSTVYVPFKISYIYLKLYVD